MSVLDRKINHSTTPCNIGSSSSDTSKDNVPETAIANLFEDFEAAFKRRISM